MNDIVFHRSRWLVGTYYVLAVAMVALALLFAMVALGNAIESVPWGSKAWAVVGWVIGALSWGIGAVQIGQVGRGYAKSYVAIGTDALRVRVSVDEGEIRIPWSDIRHVTHKRTIRVNDCTVFTEHVRYRLTKDNCSDPVRIAALVAERSGKQLEAEA